MNLQKGKDNIIGFIIKQNAENVEFWAFNNERLIVPKNLIIYENFNIKVAEWIFISKLTDAPSYKISKVKEKLDQLPIIACDNFSILVTYLFF